MRPLDNLRPFEEQRATINRNFAELGKKACVHDSELTDLAKKLSALQDGDTVSPGFEIDINTLTLLNNMLSVNTTDNAESGNGQPITSNGVHIIVGNIHSLLEVL